MSVDTLKSPIGRRKKPSANVLIATPLGRGGRGGIDRLMDALRGELRDGAIGDCQVRLGATRGMRSIFLSPIYLAAFLARLTLLRLTGRADVLHINLSSAGSAQRKMIVGRFAHRLGVPYVIHLHGSRFRSYFDTANAATQGAVRRLFSQAERVIVLGRVWRDFVADRVPEAREKVVILPNASEAITRPLQRATADPVRILFLGRLGARKGVPDLIDALGRLSDIGDWRAVIAGDGDIEDARSQVAVRGLSSRVEIPGWVGPEDAHKLLLSADILVLPSYDENLPMSVIEGLSAGLAVVATPVGAVEDIVHDGETGLLVAPGDVDALANALRRLVSDPALRARLGADGQDFHRRHLEIGAYARRLADLWTEVAR